MGVPHSVAVHRMELYTGLDSPMHRLDARTKALVTFAFIATVMSFPRYELSALTPFFLYPFAIIALSGIPFGFILKKLLLAAPFALCIGLFNPLLDRHPVMVAGGFVVAGGWLSFGSILLRFALTVSAALTLLACTGMLRLCAGLERLGLPRILAGQLLFLYRYIFVIADEALRMRRGLELRSAGSRSPALRVYGSLVGHLLLRAMDRAQRIYGAMLARGFNGAMPALQPARLQGADILFACGWLAFFALARGVNLAEQLGRLFTGGRL